MTEIEPGLDELERMVAEAFEHGDDAELVFLNAPVSLVVAGFKALPALIERVRREVLRPLAKHPRTGDVTDTEAWTVAVPIDLCRQAQDYFAAYEPAKEIET